MRANAEAWCRSLLSILFEAGYPIKDLCILRVSLHLRTLCMPHADVQLARILCFPNALHTLGLQASYCIWLYVGFKLKSSCLKLYWRLFPALFYLAKKSKSSIVKCIKVIKYKPWNTKQTVSRVIVKVNPEPCASHWKLMFPRRPIYSKHFLNKSQA